MKPTLHLGFVALVDAAPLIVAKARGEFEAERLDVSLHREVSWATIRDKIAAGVHQGGHMLAPLAIATRLGVGSEPADLIAPMSLNAHGASLGVSPRLAAEMPELTPQGLAAAVVARRSAGSPAISFAVVFPYSMHNYMLRFWAASAGVDPDRDIRITVAAPTAVAARLKSGEIDGFCVGAPWGALCQKESGARIVLDAADFWPGGPDKVLAFNARWAKRERQRMLAALRATIRAAVWADDPANADELADLLARREWLDAPKALIASSLPRIRFARQAALHPWRSHAAWIASQMLRWGQIEMSTKVDDAIACYRPDLFRLAAHEAGFDAPQADARVERDLILGGAAFDPADTQAYAAGFAITRV